MISKGFSFKTEHSDVLDSTNVTGVQRRAEPHEHAIDATEPTALAKGMCDDSFNPIADATAVQSPEDKLRVRSRP